MSNIYQIFDRSNTINAEDLPNVVSSWIDEHFPAPTHPSFCNFLLQEVSKETIPLFDTISIQSFKHILKECIRRCYTKESYENVLDKIKKITDAFPLGKYLDFYKALVVWEDRIESNYKTLEKNNRTAIIDYGIDDTARSKVKDLDQFKERINKLFEWFGNDRSNNYCHYMAPYFTMIQSSGTGKTLLLDAFREEANKEPHTRCILFDCRQSYQPLATKLHEEIVQFNFLKSDRKPCRSSTYMYFDRFVRRYKDNTSKLILLFDEAQELLKDDALYYQYIHGWLRLAHSCEVVAVFAGTTIELANYNAEEVMVDIIVDSRSPKPIYWNKERHMAAYEPFFRLTTMGCFASNSEHYLVNQSNEYEVAALYGRPLFVVHLLDKNVFCSLNDHRRYHILERMVVGNVRSYFGRISSILHIVGTRVQVGHLPAAIVSELVANGYAHLVGFHVRRFRDEPYYDKEISQIGFLPDPVCAHLAMCLMDGEWKIRWEHRSFHGRDKTFWTGKVAEIINNGIWHPRAGDDGQTATAMYLLFCGDNERKKLDRNYMTFSVDLQSYVEQLLDMKTLATKDNKMHGQKRLSESNDRISFIQVVEQNLDVPFQDLCGQSVLEKLYKSSTAVYLPSVISGFSILASIRCVCKDGTTTYVPFAVRVESRFNMKESSIKHVVNAMKDEMEQSQLKQGFCLLVILNAEQMQELDPKLLLQPSDAKEDITTTILYKVLVIQPDDHFGVSDVFRATCTSGREKYKDHWLQQCLSQRASDESLASNENASNEIPTKRPRKKSPK